MSTPFPLIRLWKRGCHGKSLEGVMVVAATLLPMIWGTNWSPNTKVTQLMSALMKFDDKFFKGKLNKGVLINFAGNATVWFLQMRSSRKS